MKTKLVLWGYNKDDKKIIVTLSLEASENKVILSVFPEALASEKAYTELMEEWKEDKPYEFPEGVKQEDRPLSIAESLLPDDVKVEETDLVTRAQSEWTFMVLSEKMFESFKSEVELITDKIKALKAFDRTTWQELKDFWSKVQQQIKDQNLQREKANELRTITNEAFNSMKELRAAQNAEFLSEAEDNFRDFNVKVDVISKRIETESNIFNEVFEELKNMQRSLKKLKMTQEQRTDLWNKLDGAFKAVKAKKFGASSTSITPLDRTKRRREGLVKALDKMLNSISRDEKEFQALEKKIKRKDFNNALEAQISEAKVVMIKNKIDSKNEKLAEMQKTLEDLDKRITTLEKKEQEANSKKEVSAKQQGEEPATGEKESTETPAETTSKPKKTKKKTDKPKAGKTKEAPKAEETVSEEASDAAEEKDSEGDDPTQE